jgi:hypothetical protein
MDDRASGRALLVLALVVSAGCRRPPERVKPDPSAPSSSAGARPVEPPPAASALADFPVAPVSRAVITVLDPGEPPRWPVRFLPATSGDRRLVLSATRALARAPTPAAHGVDWSWSLRLSLGVSFGQAADHDISWSMQKVDATCDARPCEWMKDDLSPDPYLTSALGLKRRGSPQNHSMSPYSELFLMSVAQRLTEVPPAFPDVPLGRGARWRLERPVGLGFMHGAFGATEEILYSLVSREGSVLRVDADITQKAATQPLMLTNQGDGESAKLVSMTATGKATLEVDLTGPPLATGTIEILQKTQTFWRGTGNQDGLSKEEERLTTTVEVEPTIPR